MIYQVDKIFSGNAFDAVMHFAAVAYVGESTAEPLRYLVGCALALSTLYGKGTLSPKEASFFNLLE